MQFVVLVCNAAAAGAMDLGWVQEVMVMVDVICGSGGAR